MKKSLKHNHFGFVFVLIVLWAFYPQILGTSQITTTPPASQTKVVVLKPTVQVSPYDKAADSIAKKNDLKRQVQVGESRKTISDLKTANKSIDELNRQIADLRRRNRNLLAENTVLKANGAILKGSDHTEADYAGTGAICQPCTTDSMQTVVLTKPAHRNFFQRIFNKKNHGPN